MPAPPHSEDLDQRVGHLPKAVREGRSWTSGTHLVVENTAEGVLLRPAPAFPQNTSDEVSGMLTPMGRPSRSRPKTWTPPS